MNTRPAPSSQLSTASGTGMRLLVGCVLGLSALLTLAWAADLTTYRGSEAMRDYAARVARETGLDAAWIRQTLGHASRNDRVIELMDAPLRRPVPWPRYRANHVNDRIIERGAAFMARHRDDLARAETRYGVPPQLVTAILGVETRYGEFTGSFNTRDALATLAFDYPRRAEFFTGELTAFLQLVRAGHLDAEATSGSFAGAIGIPQFMPGSMQRYGVDFDGNGRVDLNGSFSDAIGSVANYLAEHGWQPGGTVAVPVRAPETVPEDLTGYQLRHSVASLAGHDIHPRQPLAADTPVGLVDLGAAAGSERYWFGLNNFYVITRYNHSSKYAMTVWQLAEALRQEAGGTK